MEDRVMEITHRRHILQTEFWVPHQCVAATSSSSSSLTVQVDLKILWQVEHQWVNIDLNGNPFTINKSVVQNLGSQLPLLFDYKLLVSISSCLQLLLEPLLSMGVDPTFHPIIVGSVVDFARRRWDWVSSMNTDNGETILPLEVKIILLSVYVRDERTLIDFAASESMSEYENGKGMIPATDTSIEALKTKTITEIESCMICLEELAGGSEAKTMPCSHVFHSSCITKWLRQSHVCPICRFEMPT